jgi:hypothetical protein
LRFQWLAFMGHDRAPILQVGVRTSGRVVGSDLMMMVDTGADQTLLHVRWAELMGFEDTDLVEETCKSANGPMTVFRPRTRRRIEFQIGELWYSVPSLQFGRKVPVPLLGRDMIFKHFSLKMTGTDFELVPR